MHHARVWAPLLHEGLLIMHISGLEPQCMLAIQILSLCDSEKCGSGCGMFLHILSSLATPLP